MQMSGAACSAKVEQSLKDIGSVEIDVASGRVVVNSDLPWIEIQEKIEKTGRRAVLSGFGGKICSCIQTNSQLLIPRSEKMLVQIKLV